jgi:hypothetical protein
MRLLHAKMRVPSSNNPDMCVKHMRFGGTAQKCNVRALMMSRASQCGIDTDKTDTTVVIAVARTAKSVYFFVVLAFGIWG